MYNLRKSLTHVFSLPLPSLPRKLECRESKLKASSARSLGFCARDEAGSEEMRVGPGRARWEMGSETPCVEAGAPFRHLECSQEGGLLWSFQGCVSLEMQSEGAISSLPVGASGGVGAVQ